MGKIEVYGFGSFFNGSANYCDIDLLLVYENRSKDSCALAISCKRKLQEMVQDLHVTMLSKQSEQSFSFKMTARTIFLGDIDSRICNRDIEKIVGSIETHLQSRIITEGRVI